MRGRFQRNTHTKGNFKKRVNVWQESKARFIVACWQIQNPGGKTLFVSSKKSEACNQLHLTCNVQTFKRFSGRITHRRDAMHRVSTTANQAGKHAVQFEKTFERVNV